LLLINFENYNALRKRRFYLKRRRALRARSPAGGLRCTRIVVLMADRKRIGPGVNNRQHTDACCCCNTARNRKLGPSGSPIFFLLLPFLLLFFFLFFPFFFCPLPLLTTLNSGHPVLPPTPPAAPHPAPHPAYTHSLLPPIPSTYALPPPSRNRIWATVRCGCRVKPPFLFLFSYSHFYLIKMDS